MNQKSLRPNFLKSDLVAGFSVLSDFIKSMQWNVQKTDFRDTKKLWKNDKNGEKWIVFELNRSKIRLMVLK